MRIATQSNRARWLSTAVVMSCGIVTISVLPATNVVAVISVHRAVPPAAAAFHPALTAGPSAAPHPVVPTVKTHSVTAVPSALRAATQSSLALPAAQGHLVAQVTRRVVHEFSMVAVTWRQTASPVTVHVEVRTRTGGAWSDWSELGQDGDGPSAQEDSLTRAGTTPLWVADATGAEVAVYADGNTRLSGLEVDTIDPGTSSFDATLQSGVAAATAKHQSADENGTFPGMPSIVTRAQWGADESLGDACWAPRYGSTFKAAIVHHTAGSNDYTRAEAPAVVRGILAYHTISRGWCDIGYNFLIDRYGTIYEGRGGGMRRPVRGAHAGDYNINTTGISLMGNFDIAHPTRPMKNSLVKLIAWRLGTAYHGAYGRPFLYDGRFNRISGHRDVMQTACPGRYAYDWLPVLRKRVQARIGSWSSKIERRWRSDGGPGSELGVVRVGERTENGGHHTTFDHGRMYFSHHGTFTFYPGPVLRVYIGSGETGGSLGYPKSGVSSIATDGETAQFQGGRIYWSSTSRAHLMRRGAILRKYLHLGAAAGTLGFPVGKIHGIDGGTRERFQNGRISYYAATHKTTVTKT